MSIYFLLIKSEIKQIQKLFIKKIFQYLFPNNQISLKKTNLPMPHQLKQHSIIYRMFKVYIGVLAILLIFVYLNASQPTQYLHQINTQTHQLLNQLIKTRYFRLFKANLNQQCQLYVRNKLCKSKSCTVCRCDEKDIPTNWIKTDQVQKSQEGNLWSAQQENKKLQKNDEMSWSWHVEDDQNAQGEYFDIDKNIQSHTSYNGSTIWQMIYQDNCFPKTNGKYQQKFQQQQCKEQKVFYKVISGLHTSISSHLARFYKNASTGFQQWADLKQEGQRFFVNRQLYEQKVLNYPQRVENLLFIYQIYLRAIKQISPYMIENYTIHSDNTKDDNETLTLLHELSSKFQHYQFQPFDAELRTFFYKQNPKVKLYQKYIHNISRLMNCVECEKCRLFGKMQTFGIGTALKILLGYQDLYKRNEIVALYNAWNKISMSVDFYFQMTKDKENRQYQYDWFWLRWFATIPGAFIFFMYLIQNIHIEQKIKKMFKHVVFPKQKKQRINRSLLKD